MRNIPQNGGEKEAGKGGAEFPPDPPSAPPAGLREKQKKKYDIIT